MPTPTDVAGVRRFIGFTNYLSKLLPRLSEVSEPLRKLMLHDVEWFWTDIHDKAVKQVKLLVTKAPVLKYFDTTKGVTLQCDASDKGLGAVLTQDGHPIACASRALTDADTRHICRMMRDSKQAKSSTGSTCWKAYELNLPHYRKSRLTQRTMSS